MKNNQTGYPSIDRPWLKYYREGSADRELPKRTLYEFLWDGNKDHLDDVALVYEDRKFTYGELFRSVEAVARSFSALGVKKGDVVTLLLLNTPESVFCFYALNKLGAISNYVNVLSTKGDIAHELDECGGKYLLALDVFLDRVPEINGLKVITVSLVESLGVVAKIAYRAKVKTIKKSKITWKRFLAASADYTPAVYQPEHISVIGHTGGTTGVPKGLLIRDHALNGIVQEYQNSFTYERGQRFLCTIIPFALYGLCINIHMPLCLGLTTILIPKIDVNTIDKAFIKYRPNHIGTVPSVWLALCASKRMKNKDLSYLITAAAGGDGMTIELEREINLFFAEHNGSATIKKGYGMSEVCSAACTHTDAAPSKGNDVGIPWPRVIISAFDIDTHEEKKCGESGEICISSPFAMDGYLNNQAETSQLVKAHGDGRTWIHTGDLGYIDADGYVFITGRIKRIFIVRQNGIGTKVFPDRIEAVIMQSGYVRECCVIPVTDREKANRVRAYVVLNSNIMTDTAEQDILRCCRENLPI